MTGISVPVCLTGQGKTVVASVVQEKNSKVTRKNCVTKTKTQLPVSYHAVSHVPFAGGSPQKKGVIPDHQRLIKSVKGVFCVNQLSSVPNVTNVPLSVPNPPVGSRLHKFWEKWAALGVNPNVVSVLKEGYVLPFRYRPYLTREPTITSCYVDPHRNSYLVEALHQLLNKNAVELVVPCAKAQQPVAPHLGSEQLKQVSKDTNFQNGDPRDNTDLSPDRRVGDLHRLQRRVLPCPNKQSIQEVHAFSHPRQDLSIQSTSLWPVHSSHGIHSDSQRGQVASYETGYKDPPVPRRLVGQGQVPPGLSSTDTEPSNTLQGPGMVSEPRKIRAGTKTNLQFRRLPVLFEAGQGQTHPRTLAESAGQDTGDISLSSVPGPELHVPDRVTYGHRKTGSYEQIAHETYSVAPQEQLEDTGNVGEDYSHSKITSSTSGMVAGGRQCYQRSNLTPSSTCSANLYRRLKRRVGRSLKQSYGKRSLVTTREQTAHKLPRVKGSPFGLKRISSFLYRQSGSHSYRQHHCGSIHKQGRWNEVGAPVCSIMEDTDLVYQISSNPQSPTYPRSSKCHSRQVIQTGSDYSNRMVPQSRYIQGNMQPVAQTPSGPISHQVQQQTTTIRLPSPRLSSLGSGCSQSVLGGSGPLRLPTSSHLGQSGGEVAGLPVLQNNYVHPTGGWTYYFCFFSRPPSGVPLGFQTV